MRDLAELLKIAALAAVAALIFAHWLSPLNSATIGVILFYGLTVRVT